MILRKHIRKSNQKYLVGAAFSAKDFLSQEMNQGGSEEGEKVAKKGVKTTISAEWTRKDNKYPFISSDVS